MRSHIRLTGVILPDLAMPLKIIHPDHTEIMGRGLVLLSSPSYTANRRDLDTGQIVEEAALLCKSWAIIAKENKQISMGNETQSAKSDLVKRVNEFVEEYGIRCAILVSGIAEPGITVKSQMADSESEDILDIIRSGLEPHFTVNPKADQSTNTSPGPQINRGKADSSSKHSVHTVRIDLGPEERGFRKDQVVNSIADIVGLINMKLGFSETEEERSSSALD